MRSIFFGTLAAFMVATIATTEATAQARFGPGSLDVGPTLGFSPRGEASQSFGFRIEKGIKQLPSMGNGLLGVQLGVDYSTWEFGLGFGWHIIPIGLAATYHFNTGEGFFAPFLALGAGYSIEYCGGPKNVWGICEGYGSEAYPIARLGARLNVTERTAIYVDGGAGRSAANVGLMWKVK